MLYLCYSIKRNIRVDGREVESIVYREGWRRQILQRHETLADQTGLEFQLWSLEKNRPKENDRQKSLATYPLYIFLRILYL